MRRKDRLSLRPVDASAHPFTDMTASSGGKAPQIEIDGGPTYLFPMYGVPVVGRNPSFVRTE